MVLAKARVMVLVRSMVLACGVSLFQGVSPYGVTPCARFHARSIHCTMCITHYTMYIIQYKYIYIGICIVSKPNSEGILVSMINRAIWKGSAVVLLDPLLRLLGAIRGFWSLCLVTFVQGGTKRAKHYKQCSIALHGVIFISHILYITGEL